MVEPRSNVVALHAYTPGEQPTRDLTEGHGGVLKLNTNENPFPPSPKAVDALRQLSSEALRLYPPATSHTLRQAAAELHNLTPDHIIATNGGDELLRMLLSAYCEPTGAQGRGGLGLTYPTYSLYDILASTHDTSVTTVERQDDFSLPEQLADQWNQAGCKVGMIVNPHAPTGLSHDLDILRTLADQFDGLLLIDEAYVDFADHSCLDLVREDMDNVILLRSMSKGYGLAGLRVGYGIAHPDIIATLNKVRDSYNLDILAQVVATAALQDQAYARESWSHIKAQRQRLITALLDMSFEVLPSQTNFVLAQVTPSMSSAGDIYESLKKQGILVRHFKAPRLEDRLRITVGSEPQIDRLLATLTEVLSTSV